MSEKMVSVQEKQCKTYAEYKTVIYENTHYIKTTIGSTKYLTIFIAKSNKNHYLYGTPYTRS